VPSSSTNKQCKQRRPPFRVGSLCLLLAVLLIGGCVHVRAKGTFSCTEGQPPRYNAGIDATIEVPIEVLTESLDGLFKR
jgi:hypothetical protein